MPPGISCPSDGFTRYSCAPVQRRNNGQRERQPDKKLGANALLGLDLEPAVDLCDPRCDHIHANAPARNPAYCRGRRETGTKYQIDRLNIRQGLRVRGAHESLVHSGLSECGRVYSASVILDLKDEVASVMEGMYDQYTGRIFSYRSPLGGRFDAVGNGVPDHVHERVKDNRKDPLVDLGLAPEDHQVHQLALFLLQDRGQAAGTSGTACPSRPCGPRRSRLAGSS